MENVCCNKENLIEMCPCYKKGLSEGLEDLHEEWLRGIKTTIDRMRKEGIICMKEDDCGECKKIYYFFRLEEEKIR